MDASQPSPLAKEVASDDATHPAHGAVGEAPSSAGDSVGPERALRVSLRGAAAGDYVITRSQPLTLGRAARARVYDLAASRVHCRIELRGDGPYLVDLHSTNGTLLNGAPARTVALETGDEIRIGTSRIAVELRPVEESVAVCDRCGRTHDALGAQPDGERVCSKCARSEPLSARFEDEAREVLRQAGFHALHSRGGGALPRFDARCAPLDQPVTIEVLATDTATKLEVDAFLRGARLAARLHHPVVPRVLEVESAGSVVYAVWERLSGPTLADELRARGRLAPQRAIAAMLPVARAVVHLHRNDLVHGALEPEHVVLGPEGDVKLLGLGRGPGAYPEHATEEAVAEDIRALGALLLRTLTGQEMELGSIEAQLGAADVPPTLASVVVRAVGSPPAGDGFGFAGAFFSSLCEAAREIFCFPHAPEMGLEVLLSAAGEEIVDDETRRTPEDEGTGEASSTFFGRFRGMELIELAQLCEFNQKSGLLVVEAAGGERGELHLLAGRAIRARFGGLRCEPALRKLFSLRRGRFRLLVFEPQIQPEHDLALGPVLLEVLRRRDETAMTQTIASIA